MTPTPAPIPAPRPSALRPTSTSFDDATVAHSGLTTTEQRILQKRYQRANPSEASNPSESSALLTRAFGSSASPPADEASGPLEPPLSAPRAWAPNDQIGAQYILQEEVARGAWGSIWRALQPRVDRVVAIKCLLPREEQSFRAAMARFEREAKLASRIRDPSAVRIFDFGYDHGTPFLVMEWIEGMTLAEAIATHGVLPIPMIRTIGLRVSAALHAAHECGVIHRDLKPSNIMLTPVHDGWLPIVIDFGLARTFETDEPTVTRADVIIGTPAYMSPECIVGEPITPRSDLYSLGVILAECVLGSNPYRGKSAAESMTLHLQPATFDKHVLQIHGASEALANIIMNLLKQKPDERLASAHALHQALAALPPDSSVVPDTPRDANDLRAPSLPRWATLAASIPAHAALARPARVRPTRSGIAWVAALAALGIGLLILAAFGVRKADALPLGAAAEAQPAAVSLRADAPLDQANALDPSLGAMNTRDVVVPARASTPLSTREPPSGIADAAQPFVPPITEPLADEPTEDEKAPDPTPMTPPLSPSTAAQGPPVTPPRADVPAGGTSASRREGAAAAPSRRSDTRRASSSAPATTAPGRDTPSSSSASGTLVVTATPAGNIRINGTDYGHRSTVLLRDARPGDYSVTVVHGERTQSRRVAVDAGGRQVAAFRDTQRVATSHP